MSDSQQRPRSGPLSGRRCPNDVPMVNIPGIAMIDDTGQPIIMDPDAQAMSTLLIAAINTLTTYMLGSQRSENWKNMISLRLATLLHRDRHALCPITEILAKAQWAVWGGEVNYSEGKILLLPPGPEEICSSEEGTSLPDKDEDDPKLEGIFE